MKSIFLNGRYFSLAEIKKGHYEKSQLTDFELNTLNFCQDWLNQKSIFQITTSGSTGQPKLWQISRDQMLASASSTIKALGLNANDKALVCLNTAYIGGMMMLVRGLAFDLELFIIPPSGNPLENVSKYNSSQLALNFDFLALVPLQLENILTQTPQLIDVLNKAKAIIIGGAEIQPKLSQMIDNQLTAPTYHTYGMTETISHIALKRLNGKEKSDYFQTLSDVEIKLNSLNCLEIKAPVTENQWISTNDIVELIDNQHFKWIGRIDNVINSGGLKLQIEVIEQKIAEVFFELQIANAFFVAGLPDEKLGEKIHLIIEGQAFSPEIEGKVIFSLTKKLNKYEIPKKLLYFEKFYRTNTDKINRKVTINNYKLS
jgi:O-succinylbenzoic acid--CoA ligase